MEQFDLEKDLNKYVRQAKIVMPGFTLATALLVLLFAATMICIIGDSPFTPAMSILLVLVAIIDGIFGFFFFKNRLKYDIFCYFDMFPDMSAPLNVILYRFYKGRAEEVLSGTGLLMENASFTRTRQTFMLHISALEPKSNTVAIDFYIDCMCVRQISDGSVNVYKYADFLKKDDDTNTVIEKFTANIVDALMAKEEDK